MHTKKELDKRILEAGVSPLKKLGQNFLVNPEICGRIVAAVASMSPESVVEIGPGLGALTDEILGGAWKTTLIELDSGLVEFWKKHAPNALIIHGDALKTDWHLFKGPARAVLVSNLPYSIAASLVVDLSSDTDGAFGGLVLMFQKEVAQKITAKTGSDDYGIPSVLAQWAWDMEKVIDAGPQDFFPVPNVGSRVLKFTRKRTAPAGFLEFVKTAFSQRRKKLLSNLGPYGSKDEIQRAFDELGLSGDARAQELTPSQFHELFQKVPGTFLESKKVPGT